MVETSFNYVQIRGEVFRPSFPGSGHIYFTLKDEVASLSAVVWRYKASNLKLNIEEGLEVICTGKITTFAGQSKYQIIIESIKVAGEGNLLKMLQITKEKLLKEGIFDSEYKKKLPFLPNSIAVITSMSGAVKKDILHILKDRFPIHVYLWPVSVQGRDSSKEIIYAIERLNVIKLYKDFNEPDLIIIARGGGSLEDLWSFNDENLVRCVFNSVIPIVSAIGHETDTTLIDFVSDYRAATPTEAAEKIVPDIYDLKTKIKDLDYRLKNSLKNTLENNNHKFINVLRLLSKPDEIFLKKPTT